MWADLINGAARLRGACEISQESRVKRLTEGVAINGSGILHEGQEFSPTIRPPVQQQANLWLGSGRGN